VAKFAASVVYIGGKFAISVIGTSGKFAACVVDTSGKFAASVIETGGAPWLAKNFWKNLKWPPNVIYSGLGEDDSRKNLQQKISRHCPFITKDTG
jgi:hypothetical protein